MGINQPLIKLIPSAIKARGKEPEHEVENTLLSLADVENEGIYTSDPTYAYTGTSYYNRCHFLTFQHNCLNGFINRNYKS